MKNDAKQIAQSIVQLLRDQGQLEVLPDIIEELEQLTENQINQVTIETASELDPQSMSQIVEILSQKLGYQPQVEHVINPKLIAGIRIKVKDQLIDATIRNQLENIFDKIH